MTYNVFGGMLNLAQSINQFCIIFRKTVCFLSVCNRRQETHQKMR